MSIDIVFAMFFDILTISSLTFASFQLLRLLWCFYCDTDGREPRETWKMKMKEKERNDRKYIIIMKKSGWSVKTVFIVVHYIYWTNTKNAQRWQNCLTFNGNRKKGQQKNIRWKMAKSIKKKRQKNKSENCRFAKRKSNLYIRIYLSQLPICFHLFHWLPTGCDLAATSIQFAGSCVTIFWGPLCFDMSFYSLLFAYQKSLDCYYNNISLLDVGNDNLLNKSCNIIVWIWME